MGDYETAYRGKECDVPAGDITSRKLTFAKDASIVVIGSTTFLLSLSQVFKISLPSTTSNDLHFALCLFGFDSGYCFLQRAFPSDLRDGIGELLQLTEISFGNVSEQTVKSNDKTYDIRSLKAFLIYVRSLERPSISLPRG